MNEILIQNGIEREKVRIMKKNSVIEIPLMGKDNILKEMLNGHQKRLFSLFVKKMEYLKSTHKNTSYEKFNWNNATLKASCKICGSCVELFWHKEDKGCSGYIELVAYVRLNKDIIVSLDVFNSLKVSF